MVSKKIKILAIDDNEDNLVILKALIKDEFPDAITFTALNGTKGIELAAKEDPDVILLDIVMPDMDGYEVCQKLKADDSLSDIPVVFVTALKGDKESRIRALECGAEGFLSKPIDESELIAQIRAMVKIKEATANKRNEKERLKVLVQEQTKELQLAYKETLKLLDDVKMENEERKLAEKKILENEMLLIKIAENYPNSFISIIEEDFTIGFASGQEFINQNLDPKQFIGLTLEQVFGDDTPIVKKYYKDTFNGEEQSFELLINEQYQYYRTVPLFDIDGSVSRILAVVENITKRKLVEQALNERIKELDGIYSLGLLAEKFETMEEIYNEFVNIIVPESLQFPEKVFVSLEVESKKYCNNENFKLLKDGKYLSAPINIFKKQQGELIVTYTEDLPFLDLFEQKLINNYAGRISKITERIKTRAILKESEKQLLQLNADKDRFISILGHDLKNPFHNVLGFSEVLIEDIRKLSTDEIENIAKDINKTARTSYKLLEDILLWARSHQGKIPFNPQNLSLKEIFNDAIEVINPSANAKKITINYSATDHINVFADIDMLKTVLRNLLTNAIKFTNNNGRINITAEFISGNVTISVSDNGIGIPPDSISKLFNISEVLTTKGTAGETGTGLGLLLCNDFVEKHQGKIWVESEVGKGSEFKFTLPFNYEPKEINVVPSDAVDSQTKNQKILITDDDDSSRKFLGIIIRMFSNEILYAKTGIEAVVACKDNPDIDLILMDIKMPVMDGFEATRQIRQFNKEVFIIMQSAFAGSEEKEKAEEAGCNAFISKPINKTLLQELIKKHCNN